MKEFYDIYTEKYNPALFTVEETTEQNQKSIFETKINRTFFSFFSEPVDCKQELRKLVMSYAE